MAESSLVVAAASAADTFGFVEKMESMGFQFLALPLMVLSLRNLAYETLYQHFVSYDLDR